MDISFILLHLSTLLTFILLILIIRIKYKKALHYYFIFAVIDIFLWCALWLVHQYLPSLDQNTELIFYNCFNTLLFCISALLFFIGYVFSKSGSKINPRINILFLVPVTSIIVVWTNPLHHLYYLLSSGDNNLFARGPLWQAASYIDFGFIILGLFFLIRFSIKNSGFFSRQSILILLGALVPVIIDFIVGLNVYALPKYLDAIAFSATVICFLIAMFRFDLFTVMPVALQTIVDHISDGYIVLNDHMEITDFNKPFVDGFGVIANIRRKAAFEGLFQGKVSEKTTEILDRINKSVLANRLDSFEIHISEEK